MITTLRIQDALSLVPSDFEFKDGNCFMNKHNTKTGAISQMPLPKVLSDKFNSNIGSLGRVFTIKPNKAIIYSRLKDLFYMYPEMHEQITIKKIGVHGEDVSETRPYYLAVHPHMLRRTAITTMLVNGVSERHIKFASGHTPKSTAFERYVGFVEKKYQSDINDYYNNFLG
jgi:integrase